MQTDDTYLNTADNADARFKASDIISLTFHPLLVPIYSVLMFCTLSFFRSLPLYHVVLVIFLVCVFAFVIPYFALHWLEGKGAISSIGLPSQKDRTVPYFICGTCLLICAILLSGIGACPFVFATIYAGSACVFICTIINFWSKISIHTAAMGCWFGSVVYLWTDEAIGLLAGNSVTVICSVALLSGISASIRIASNIHTQLQVLGGFVAGFCVGLCTLHLFFLQGFI